VITYTPASTDVGKTIIITATTNNPAGAPCTAVTADWSITVHPAFNAGSISGTGQICSGQTTAVTMGPGTPASGGNSAITYQWKKSIDGATAQVISGANGPYYTLPTGDADRINTGASNKVIVYTREAHDGVCQLPFVASGGSYTLTVRPARSASD
jgi:hypothetical protein